MDPKSTPAAHAIQLAADITKACEAAGITDPLEIPALIAFAQAAEHFNTAFEAHQKAVRAYNRFIASHGTDDPGQDEYVREVTAAREVYQLARRGQQIALQTYRVARGLEASAPAAIAA